MSGIPEDIDLIASDIVRADYSEAAEPDYALYLAMAKAINAERERCAEAIRMMSSNTGMYVDRRDAIAVINAPPAPKGGE